LAIYGASVGTGTTSGTISATYVSPSETCTFSGGGGGYGLPLVTFSAIPSVGVGQEATTNATVQPSNNSKAISLSVSSAASIVSPTASFTSNTAVVVEGVSLGTATLNATVANPQGGQPITVGTTSFPVTPSITNIFPAQGLVGTGETVTISGAGFVIGQTTIGAGPNITVSNTSVTSSTQMTATFTPTNSASAGGNQAVTVSVNGGTPSNSQNFYVQIPTHIARTTVSGQAPAGPLEDGIGPLLSGSNLTIYTVTGAVYENTQNVCGGYQWYGYQVLDQETSPVAIANGTIAITETFSNISPTPDPLQQPQTSTTTLSLPNAYLLDIYGNYNPAPSCPPANVSDSYTQQFTAAVGGTQYNMTTVINIARTTNAQGYPTFTSNITTQ
jgi:IPT/TIG domain